jgi:hypothetical protein
MNEDGKNDWDRKADEIDEVIHQLVWNARHEEERLAANVDFPALVFGAVLNKLEGIKRHCQGLADSHRVNEKTGREGA